MRLALTIASIALAMIPAPRRAQNDRRPDASILALMQAFSDARGQYDGKALDVLLAPD